MMNMKTDTFTYRVSYNLYGSARLNKNLIPRPGEISLDQFGIFTLIDTSDQQNIIQKTFAEIVGIRPLGHSRFSAGRAVIYVDHNEAYIITFFSNAAVTHDTMDIYQKLLQGHKEAAIDDFKMLNTHKISANAAAEISQANADYDIFVDTAKRFGVYKSPFSSAPFVVTIILVAVVIGLLLLAFLLTR